MDNPFQHSGNKILSFIGATGSLLFNGACAILWSDIEVGVRVALGVCGIFSAIVAGRYHMLGSKIRQEELKIKQEELKKLVGDTKI